MREHDRLGAAVAAAGEQFEGTTPVGLRAAGAGRGRRTLGRGGTYPGLGGMVNRIRTPSRARLRVLAPSRSRLEGAATGLPLPLRELMALNR
jgi:hypothetical protein